MNKTTIKQLFTVSIDSVSFYIEIMQYTVFKKSVLPHAHVENCYEIHYIDSGYGSLYTDTDTFALTPGTLFITGPHITHAQAPDVNDPMAEYCIYFTVENKYHDKRPLDKEWQNVLSILDNNSFWIGTDDHNVSVLMHDLIKTASKRESGYNIAINGLFLQFLVALTRNISPSEKTISDTVNKSKYKSVPKTIDRAFMSYDITLDKLANKLNLSPRQLERLVWQLYGKNFREKKLEARMVAASSLLIYSDKSIAQIADRVGYSCTEHFSTAFRKYYKQSPSAYRKEHKSISQLSDK